MFFVYAAILSPMDCFSQKYDAVRLINWFVFFLSTVEEFLCGNNCNGIKDTGHFW